jgi:hypothetical protein
VMEKKSSNERNMCFLKKNMYENQDHTSIVSITYIRKKGDSMYLFSIAAQINQA